MTTQPGKTASMTLFRSHFDRIRRRLEAEGNAARSFHHGLNRGLIREAFIREFLAQNISDLWGVSTGEIFDRETKEGEIRNQIDVVIHNKRYPKLPLAASIDLFFIETVSSTIEIKSRLTYPESTEGRREDSGRGWVRELQGRWPGVGVDGRAAEGLQSPHRAPKALCGSCDARDCPEVSRAV